MKLKKGKRVRLRNDLIVGKYYGEYDWSDTMDDFSGKEVTISTVLQDSFTIVEDLGFCNYTREMVDKVLFP